MHIHKEFSRHSLADHLDTYSELAVFLLAKTTHLLTHSFKIANDNGFQFHGHALGCQCTNGNVRVVMCLFYPPTSCIIEDHTDIIPFMDIDVQLLTNLVIMIEKLTRDVLFNIVVVIYLWKHMFNFSPCPHAS